MKNTQNIAIAVLGITAVILAGILLGSYTTQQAYGEVSVKQGDYIMCPFILSNSTDLIAITDIAAKKMIVYGINFRNASIDQVGPSVDLETSFK